VTLEKQTEAESLADSNFAFRNRRRTGRNPRQGKFWSSEAL